MEKSKAVNINIETWSFCLLAFLLPVFPKFVPLSIALVALAIIIQLIRNRKNEKRRKLTFKPQYLFVLLFLLYLIGMSYSENMNFGWKDIEAKLSFVVFPLLFGLIYIRRVSLDLKQILLFFIIGSLVSVAFNIYGAVSCFVETDSIRCFTSSFLAYKMHVNHISMYYGLAIFALLTHPFGRALKYAGVSVFLLSIALLLSIGGYIAVFGGSITLFILLRKKIRHVKLITTSLIAIFALIFFAFYREIKSNYDQMYQNIDTKQELYERANTYSESLLTRMVVWDIAIQTFNSNPFGVGTGDVKDVLIERYKKEGLTKMERQRLNPHNQYFQTGVSIGYPGIITLVLLLLFTFIRAIKRKNNILSAFVVMISLNMLFESFLEIQAGIIFCAFFLLLLDFSENRRNQNEIEKQKV